ncbi:hypothetical protein WJX74_005907 [Apatococcus lobatus]|uniref:RING-type E3 ubiquitin transferase n=1 Tax=Apatococcus lobatus TaxID=904363 RepID=A0AAW1RBF5_9CHLO
MIFAILLESGTPLGRSGDARAVSEDLKVLLGPGILQSLLVQKLLRTQLLAVQQQIQLPLRAATAANTGAGEEDAAEAEADEAHVTSLQAAFIILMPLITNHPRHCSGTVLMDTHSQVQISNTSLGIHPAPPSNPLQIRPAARDHPMRPPQTARRSRPFNPGLQPPRGSQPTSSNHCPPADQPPSPCRHLHEPLADPHSATNPARNHPESRNADLPHPPSRLEIYEAGRFTTPWRGNQQVSSSNRHPTAPRPATSQGRPPGQHGPSNTVTGGSPEALQPDSSGDARRDVSGPPAAAIHADNATICQRPGSRQHSSPTVHSSSAESSTASSGGRGDTDQFTEPAATSLVNNTLSSALDENTGPATSGDTGSGRNTFAGAQWDAQLLQLTGMQGAGTGYDASSQSDKHSEALAISMQAFVQQASASAHDLDEVAATDSTSRDDLLHQLQNVEAAAGRQSLKASLDRTTCKDLPADDQAVIPEEVSNIKEAETATSSLPNEEELAADCLLCCEPLEVVAVGMCNHRNICAKCTIRLRLCYNKRLCPLCKTHNAQVVLARSTYCSIPKWSELDALMTTGSPLLLEQPRWARGVWFYQGETAQPAFQAALGAHKVRSLEKEMVGWTARACPICDPRGSRPLTNNKSLQQHMQRVHGRLLCQTCLQERRSFPLELEPMTKDALMEHVAQAHFRCSICSDLILYDEERYLNHMHQRHYKCHLCAMSGQDASWHRDWHHLNNHFRADHYQCEHELCEGCMAAFNTELELHEHWAEQPDDGWGSDENSLSSNSDFGNFLQEQVEQYVAAGISREMAIAMVRTDIDEDIHDQPQRSTSPAEGLELPGSNEAARSQLAALDSDLVELERLLIDNLIPSASASAGGSPGSLPAANLRQAHALLQSSTQRRNYLVQHLQAHSSGPEVAAGSHQNGPPSGATSAAAAQPLQRSQQPGNNRSTPRSSRRPLAASREPHAAFATDQGPLALHGNSTSSGRSDPMLTPVIHAESSRQRNPPDDDFHPGQAAVWQQPPASPAHPITSQSAPSSGPVVHREGPWRRTHPPAAGNPPPAAPPSAGAPCPAAGGMHNVPPHQWHSQHQTQQQQRHTPAHPRSAAAHSTPGSWRRAGASPPCQQAAAPIPNGPQPAAQGNHRGVPQQPRTSSAASPPGWGPHNRTEVGGEGSGGRRGWNDVEVPPVPIQYPADSRPFVQQHGSGVRGGFALETPGGLNLIDDDLGWAAPVASSRSTGQQRGSRGRRQAGQAPQGPRAAANGPTRGASGDAFPSLAESASATTAAPDPTYLRPALVRQIARCPCGHIARPVVLEEGRQPSSLHCSAACTAAARRAQLDSAFGVNPQTYVSWVDRARVPEYSPEQMIWAQERSPVLKSAEGAMAAFVQAGPSEQRTSLGSLSRRDREQLHRLSEEYGLVTQSIGNGTQRNLMVYKPQNPGSGRRPSVPGLLLSEAAGRSTRAQLDEDLAAAQAKLHPVHLQDVRPGFELERLPYEGIVEASRTGYQTADLWFETEALRSDFLARVGRGWRRDFTVQQSL